MVRNIAAWLAAAVLLLSPIYMQGHGSVLNQVLTAPASAGATPLSVRGIAQRLTAWAKAPVIVELVNQENVDPTRGRVRLQGKTVAQALGLLATADQGYSWRELGGVVVIRPADAWRDGRSPLNAHVNRSIWRNAPVARVFCDIAKRLGLSEPDEAQFTQPVALDRLSATAEGTVLSLLASAVRAHGALLWEISYDSAPEHPVERFSMRIFRADGSNFGLAWAHAPRAGSE